MAVSSAQPSSAPAAPLVSLVFPVLNEEENALALVDRFREIVEGNPSFDFELVVVDDGSTDRTVELVTGAMRPGELFQVVELARNFGSHYGLSAGLAHARGDALICLGGDLQEPPSLITEMLRQWHELGIDTVWGVRRTRVKTSFLGGLFSRGFSKLFHRYSDLKAYPAEGPSGVLCSRAVIDTVNRIPERNRNTYGLIAWAGFRQTTVLYDQVARRAGASKWTTSKLFKLAVDSFVQFSSAPIRLMTYVGFGIAMLGFLYGVLLVGLALVSNDAPSGWTTVMVVMLVVGGFQLLMLGVLGEYLWRAADESRQRPLYIVRRVIGPDDVLPAPSASDVASSADGGTPTVGVRSGADAVGPRR